MLLFVMLLSFVGPSVYLRSVCCVMHPQLLCDSDRLVGLVSVSVAVREFECAGVLSVSRE